jgi:hypothetical protein
MSPIGIWFAYLHTAGTIVIKRYIDEEDLSEARDSPFVKRVIPPFEAFDREEAERIVNSKVNNEELDE